MNGQELLQRAGFASRKKKEGKTRRGEESRRLHLLQKVDTARTRLLPQLLVELVCTVELIVAGLGG